MLACQKGIFSLPEGAHFLNCAYMSPLAEPVEAAGVAGLLRKRDPTGIDPSDFFTGSELVRERFARLVGTRDAGRVAIVPAASYGLAVVARNTPVERGQNLVVAAEQFPSNVYPWRRLAGAAGAEVRTVEPPAEPAGRGAAWNERILEAIDARTALVALGHVHWADGTRFDLEAVGERAREVGAALVVDGTQSVGALPFDVERIRPDALVCAGYKWLLGPYGAGCAWLGPRYDGGEPLEENWISRAGSEDFRGLVDYRDDYQPGARRFDVGERSNPILLPMLAAALELLLEWGVEEVQRYCRSLTGDLVAEAVRLGYSVEEEAWRASHLFGIRAPAGVELPELQARLAERRVAVSVRGSALRVSPHVYNDADDVAALAEVLREAVEK